MSFWFEPCYGDGKPILPRTPKELMDWPRGRHLQRAWTNLLRLPVPESEVLTPGDLMDAIVRIDVVYPYCSTEWKQELDHLKCFFNKCIRKGYGCIYSP